MTIDGQVSQYSVNGPIFSITESLHLSYIIGAVCGGVAVLLFIAGACILYHRFKSSDNGINTCLFAAECSSFLFNLLRFVPVNFRRKQRYH